MFSNKGIDRTGGSTITSSTSAQTIFETNCTESGLYKIKANLTFKSKNCDVASILKINDKVYHQHQFRACTNFSPTDTLESVVYLVQGDVINISVAQNSGADATVEYIYTYWK